MMDDYRLTSATIGLCIAGIIFYLVRKDWVHSRHAISWLFLATTIALLGVFPEGVDGLGILLGISYPPILPLIVGFGLVIVKVLIMDIHSSNLERQLQRLAQQLAILEEELERSRRNRPGQH